MTDGRYVIFASATGWNIRFNNEENGPYKSMAEAVLCAIDAAIELGSSGMNTEVCLLGEDGRLQTQWAYRGCRRPATPTQILALPPSECAAVLSDAAALRELGGSASS